MTAIGSQVWHYPRPGFTQSVFQTMIGGGADALRLFGPRRIGKTQFLLYDLGYRAVREGHRAVYVSFWQNIPAPLETLALECERVLGPLSARQRLTNWLGESKTRIEAKGGPLAGSIEHPGKPVTARDPWARLQAVLDRLNNPRKPAFLFLDEFQAIADHPDARAILDRLRIELKQRANGVKVIFSGSSVNGLRRIFDKDMSGKGAFFDFAAPRTLPVLDDGFVPFVLEVARRELFSTIPDAEARQVFADCDRNPQMFRNWVQLRSGNPRATLADIIFDSSDTLAFEQRFARLSPRARIMARMIGEGVAQPRGKTGAAWWMTFSGTAAPTAAQRGTDITTLVEQDIIHPDEDRRGYAMTDPVFGTWLKMQPKTAFQNAGAA